ncbi:MAG: hypothetical protein IJP68_08335 [Selenomonadaceae bacterium]|nr:hypothetical protein [Selenomonadaceae bacterium]
MQRGLATLEIIFAIIIIGVLVKVAVPNAARILDTAALDYETKKLYSELRFVQEMNRSSTVVSTGTGRTEQSGDYIILTIKRNEKFYQVSRGTASLGEPHNFSYGVTVKLENSNDEIIRIYFKSDGKADINDKNSDTLTLTSRLGKKRYIRVNSVGRIRAALTND